MSNKRRHPAAWALTLLILLIVLDLFTGSADIGIRDMLHALTGGIDGISSVILLRLRLPRIVTAVIAGSALAISGAQMQAIFRNPLADPHILGISAGAGTGVAALTLMAGILPHSGWLASSGIGITLAAALGAGCISMVIMWIATRVRQASALLITGVMIGFVMSALTSIMEYQADESRLKAFWSWSAGSFSGNSWNEAAIMASTLVIGIVIAISRSKALSVLLFGDDYAAAAGVNAKRTRSMSMLGCCIMTGTVTAFCGPIGFVGIVAPHAARLLSGRSSMQTVLPMSLLTGASISVAGDFLSQLPDSPLPVGSTIAIIGIPFIFMMLYNSSVL